ncbi:MAG: hypothetical protein GTO45_14045 [Candidatus Aminicenantes bacterium]|nr:hypothetical protein [Candidatus Aminicenantes bacterium]NIM79890.1 hypothetical protein [Candidatus Aminicenantes bacterium]NIN19227.1 hypothetical protein [Candidatus Aminicenantes bacterium]NIN43132.1 hypothetical protein [Candidatus Aminicenantes bacterium]NIN85869.1 hypothetical protein [Candidatus Aminicenantes bacterium]
MTKSVFDVTVFNEFKTARDVKILHRKHQITHHHIVKEQDNIKIEVSSTAPPDKEYLVIDLDHAPGELPACKVTLQPVDPQKSADFTFIPSGAINLRIFHRESETILGIPGRVPEWKLRVAKPKESKTGPGVLESQNVTLQEDEPVYTD